MGGALNMNVTAADTKSEEGYTPTPIDILTDNTIRSLGATADEINQDYGGRLSYLSKCIKNIDDNTPPATVLKIKAFIIQYLCLTLGKGLNHLREPSINKEYANCILCIYEGKLTKHDINLDVIYADGFLDGKLTSFQPIFLHSSLSIHERIKAIMRRTAEYGNESPHQNLIGTDLLLVMLDYIRYTSNYLE